MTDPSEAILRRTPAASFVVFDRATGEILLTHHVSAAPGAAVPAEAELTRFILQHAVLTTGREEGAMDCLKIAAADLQPMAEYRVDPEQRSLVRTKRPDEPPSEMEAVASTPVP